VLTFLGIGLIVLSLSAFRSVNEASGDSVDQAFLKAVEESNNRLFKLFFLPIDLAVACKEYLTRILFFPYRLVSRGVTKLSETALSFIDYIQTWFLWIFNLPGDFFSTIYNRFGDLYQYLGSLILDRIQMLKTSTTKSPIGRFLQETAKGISGIYFRTRIRWIRVNKMLSDIAIAIEEFGVPYLEMLSRIAEDSARNWKIVRENVGGRWVTTQSWLASMNHWFSEEYNTLNRKICRWGLRIDSMISDLASTIRNMLNT
jgi:hypothetical protein